MTAPEDGALVRQIVEAQSPPGSDPDHPSDETWTLRIATQWVLTLEDPALSESAWGRRVGIGSQWLYTLAAEAPGAGLCVARVALALMSGKEFAWMRTVEEELFTYLDRGVRALYDDYLGCLPRSLYVDHVDLRDVASGTSVTVHRHGRVTFHAPRDADVERRAAELVLRSAALQYGFTGEIKETPVQRPPRRGLREILHGKRAS